MPVAGHFPTEVESKAIEFVSRAFRAGVPIRKLLDEASNRHGTAAWASESAQQEVLNATIFFVPNNSPPGFTFGKKRQARFVRALMDEVDHVHGATPHELLVEAAATACQSSENIVNEEPLVYVVLDMPSKRKGGICPGMRQNVISISSLFSELGCRLWEAGLYLYGLLVSPNSPMQQDISGKHVLELGSGTGLSAAGFLEAEAAHVVLSDYKQNVVDNIRTNVNTNIPLQDRESFQIEVLNVFDLEGLKQFLDGNHINTLIAADITYDPSLRGAVVKAFQVAVADGSRVGYLLATRRNSATEHELRVQLQQSGLHFEQLTCQYDMALLNYLCNYEFNQVQVFRLSQSSPMDNLFSEDKISVSRFQARKQNCLD